jgi:ribosomal protein S3
MKYENRDFARMIGEFYLIKNRGDYKKTSEEIATIQITGVDYNCRVLRIVTGRPGLIIGRRGENIDKLKEYVLKQIGEIFELKIIEDKVIPYLYPYEPYDIFDEDL